jgi:hypothetical protein
MHQAGPVVLQGAMDVFTLIVIAVIAINFLGPLFKAIARALSGASTSADQQARQRLSQTLQQSSASPADAHRAQELDRLRRALLASAGVAEEEDSRATQSGVPATPYVQVQTVAPSAQPPARAWMPPGTTASTTPTAPSAPMAPRAASSRRQRRITATTVARLPAPVAVTTTAPVMGDTLQGPGSLLTLESAAAAFQPLAITGDDGASRARAARLAPLAVLQGPDAGMNLFVAAAIIGPCAANRPLGHMPGGW